MRVFFCIAAMTATASLIAACTYSHDTCGDPSPITATIAGIRAIEAGRISVQSTSNSNDSSSIFSNNFIPLNSTENNTIAAAELALKIDFLTSEEQRRTSWLDFFFRSASACTSAPAYHRSAINNISTLQLVANSSSQNAVLPNQTQVYQVESWQPRSFTVAGDGQTLSAYLDNSNAKRITSNLVAVGGFGDQLVTGFTVFSATAVLDNGDSFSHSVSINIE